MRYPDGMPFYIGKGKGNRVSDHGSTRGRPAVNAIIKAIRANGEDVIRDIVRDGMSEDDAFSFERETIIKIGRAPNGPLVNANDGGHGGRNPSDETREKIRAARLRQAPPPPDHMKRMKEMRGPFTDEQKAKMSARLTGRKLSEETKRKLSEKAKARKIWASAERMAEVRANRSPEISEATRDKLRKRAASMVWTDEMRQKISAAQVGRKSCPEANAKRSATLKGRAKTPEHLAAIAAAKAARKSAASN